LRRACCSLSSAATAAAAAAPQATCSSIPCISQVVLQAAKPGGSAQIQLSSWMFTFVSSDEPPLRQASSPRPAAAAAADNCSVARRGLLRASMVGVVLRPTYSRCVAEARFVV
jgi:hypothetical protein